MLLIPLGTARLFEVSGQLTNETALLQLKIPDDTYVCATKNLCAIYSNSFPN